MPRSELNTRTVHVAFVLNKVALEEVCFRVLRFYPDVMSPQMLHTQTHVSLLDVCNIPDQPTRYYIESPQPIQMQHSRLKNTGHAILAVEELRT
jgi:hypothetical protein